MSLLFKIDEEDVSIVERGWLQVVDEVHELHLEQEVSHVPYMCDNSYSFRHAHIGYVTKVL